MENEEYTIIVSSSNEKDLKFLSDFSKQFQNKTVPSLNQSISTQETDTSKSEEELKRSESEKSDVSQEPSKKEEELKRLWQVLALPVNRKFLLDNLVKYRDPSKDLFEIKLPIRQFEYLKDILSQLLQSMFDFLKLKYSHDKRKGRREHIAIPSSSNKILHSRNFDYTSCYS
jgi:hypothetical protein